jgi:hypothetical protein
MVKKILFASLVFSLFSFQTAAQAGSFSIPTTGFAQQEFIDLSRELGLAISYVPAAPAEPLGIVGFDAGLEITAVPISQDNSFWKAVAPGAPSMLPLPKIHLQKGLPLGIDVGAVYSSVSQLDLSMFGAEIKYAIIAGNVALPAVAVRAAYTQLTGVDSLDLSTLSADISVSKGVAFVTPYAGVGMVQVKAKEKAGLGLQDVKENLTKGFVGVKISIAVINFVFEADFAEVPLYTLRLNVGL